MKIRLDGSRMLTREDMYDHIIGQFKLSEDHGRNLDALWDFLSTCAEYKVELINSQEMLNSLQGYGCKLLKCFFDADAENDSFTFRLV